MTIQNAIEILAVKENDSIETIENQYKKKVSDLKLKINNSPSHLSERFEQNLKELGEAFELVSTFKSTNFDDTQFLPSVHKVEETTPTKAEESKDNSSKKVDKSKLQKLQRTYLLIIIGLAVLCSTFVVLFVDARTKRDEAEKSAEKVKKNSEQWEIYEGLVKEGKFNIQNKGTKPFYITRVKSIFKKGNQFKEFVLENLTDKLEPNSSKFYEKVVGNEKVYDGSVLFYSIWVSDLEGNQTVFEDVNHGDAILINLDNSN